VSAEPTGTSRSNWTGVLTPRRIVALALAALMLVFVLQNRDDATFQLLGFQVTGPLWFASLALLGAGVAIGVLVSTRSGSDPRR
jgi:uncharacterized integral membrane protein